MYNDWTPLKVVQTLMLLNNSKVHVVDNKYGWKLSLPVNMQTIKHAVCCINTSTAIKSRSTLHLK